jgi:hypothetical protein
MAIKTEVLRAAVAAYLARPDVAPRLGTDGVLMADVVAGIGIPAAAQKHYEKQIGLVLRGLGLIAAQVGRGRARSWVRPIDLAFVVAPGEPAIEPIPVEPAPVEPAPVVPPAEPATPVDARVAEARAAEARASARRRASDFEALKPADLVAVDFDTSVANDPASRAVSKQAAAEKRQEFSLNMGVHLENLRLAATEEEVDYGSLLDAMPIEDAAYVGELAEQERRFGNRRMARSLSLFAAGEELSRRLFASACQQYLTGRVEPSGYAARPSIRPPSAAVVCLLLSDLHLGSELDARENPIPFGPVEEARRLEYVMRQAIDYKPQYRATASWSSCSTAT